MCFNMPSLAPVLRTSYLRCRESSTDYLSGQDLESAEQWNATQPKRVSVILRSGEVIPRLARS